MKAISYHTLFIGLFCLSITPAVAQHPEPTLLRDVNPGPGDGTRYLQVIHGKIFFVGDNGVNGGEPWISDGTTGGTQMIKNINTPIPGYPYDQGSVPSNAVSLNTKISFLARYESEMGTNEALFLTDGTEAGTIKYADNIGAE